tara:strand:+ start:481 stop:1884 length:1404 start_codon:yes stop_codon:yes gene_type:complete
MTVGTQERPLTSAEPMKIAEALIRGVFKTPTNKRGLWAFRGDYYQWYGNVWKRRDTEWLEDLCWLELEDAYYQEIMGDGTPRSRRLVPNKQKIDNIIRALTAKCRIPHSKVPVWLNDPSKDGGSIISFQDVLFDASNGDVIERNEDWFDPIILPVGYVDGAACPRWMKCLDEWSNNDSQWIELLQRWMGYCLMNHRRHARWLLMYGKVRSGKGTISKVLQRLLGQDAFMNSSLDDLSNDFGLDGLEHSRVLCVGEVSELAGKEGERATRVLKNIIGQDPLTVNVKFKRQMRNVVVNAAPIVQANEIPTLPNKGRGLSSKMLVLPFDVSFEGKEDPYLIDTLSGELMGIAAWCVEGAVKLENSKERFPFSDRAKDTMKMYHLQNNPFDYFLEERFIKSVKGFVATDLLWMQWNDWLKKNEIKKLHIPRNQLSIKIETQSSWAVSRYRVHGGKRGLKGLSLRKSFEDLC